MNLRFDQLFTSCRSITADRSAEKSGQEEFDFEYGEDFSRHIEAFQPPFCKVLVRHNPVGDRALNKRQAERLATIRLSARKEPEPFPVRTVSSWATARTRRYLEFVDIFEGKARAA